MRPVRVRQCFQEVSKFLFFVVYPPLFSLISAAEHIAVPDAKEWSDNPPDHKHTAYDMFPGGCGHLTLFQKLVHIYRIGQPRIIGIHLRDKNYHASPV